jgi:hypothetical protein
MGIFDSEAAQLLLITCPQCGRSGQLLGTVEEAACPGCGYAAVHVCLADEDSIRQGI